MKFIHTADWHLGKQLHKQSLAADMDRFFEWLVALIDAEGVDLLLVSGDIFDMANPANEDRQRYYRLLGQLAGRCRVVITGGNHDSASMLDAPKELLHSLDITVVGGIDPAALEQEVVPIPSSDDPSTILAVVLAVPYLRDSDVRQHNDSMEHDARAQAMRRGIIDHYGQLVALAVDQYGALPLIAMGHLWLHGASTSDSEREITVGQLGGVDHTQLTTSIDYMALGHIHRPQIVDAAGKIRYSGSPIPLSFSEREDSKSILLGSITDGKVEVAVKPVPSYRQLTSMSGSLAELTDQLSTYAPDTPLPSLVELHLREAIYDPSVPQQLGELVDSYRSAPFNIIKERITYEQSAQTLDRLYEGGIQIEDLSPLEIFDKMLDDQVADPGRRAALREAYQLMVDKAQQL